jgi:hypothetical protein
MTGLRGRVARQDVVQAERRRRKDTTIDGSQRLKLAIPPEVAAQLKAEGRTPRWVNDEGNRMHNLTQMDDYDKVRGVDPIVVGTGPDGKPVKAHLCSKPAEFIEEDRAAREAIRKETEEALLRGKNPNDPIAGRSDFYVDPASSIQHGAPSKSPAPPGAGGVHPSKELG